VSIREQIATAASLRQHSARAGLLCGTRAGAIFGAPLVSCPEPPSINKPGAFCRHPAYPDRDRQKGAPMTSSAKRRCGDCTLCCKVMAIEELEKPANSWCPHCKPGRGCAIYHGRPAECGNFSCLWLVNDLLDEQLKPNKSKFVLTASEDGIEVRCDPGFPNAWRKEPYASEIRGWAISGESNDVTVVVIVGQRMILVTPDREFDLGIVGPDERIVRELEGTKVVGARVVKDLDL
jgi:hypothetical protein